MSVKAKGGGGVFFKNFLIYPAIYPSAPNMFTHLSIYLSQYHYLSIYLSIYLSTHSPDLVGVQLNNTHLLLAFWLNSIDLILSNIRSMLNRDLELLQVHGSFWTIRIQRGMIKQKVLTAGHPTLYFWSKSKPLFNTKDIFTVEVTIFFFYETLL